MTDPARMSARLLFRVEPLPLESPRGYLCRVASAHGYDDPQWLVHIAGFSGYAAALEREDHERPIARVLRLDPQEWLAMSYRPVKGAGRFAQRAFCGRTVHGDQFNYRRPRICPDCLRERPVWWAIWDLGLVAACPLHRSLLINQCPVCSKDLVWRRPAVEKCRCGADLRAATAEAASADLVAMNTLIYLAAGYSPGAAAECQLGDYHFPPELGRLALGPLLRLIRFVGLIGEKDRLRRKQRPFLRTDLLTAIQAGQAATVVLRDWPRPLREALRGMVPEKIEDAAALRLNDVFGNFYRHLFHVLPRNEFGFLHEAFESFVLEEWKGLIRGQHRRLSVSTRKKSPWMAANQAEQRARIYSKRIEDLVRQGKIEGTFLNVRRGGSRSECWIRRESLDQWIATRETESARYMSRPDAKRSLGLTNCTIVNVAAAGVIRYVEGPEQNFPGGCFFFLREDVMKIKGAFEKHTVPMMAYSGPGKLIALRHAMKNYLGRGSGLAAAIQAVVDGNLIPVGYTQRFPGITGYLFLSEQLRRYRPVPEVEAHPEGFLNFREAASMLGIRSCIVRGLVAQGMLTVAPGYRNGFSKLLAEQELRRFAEGYVATSVLAKRFRLNSGSFARHLKALDTPLLAIPIPDAGRGHTFFIRKDVAAQIQIPSRRTLREEAQRRIVAAHKRRWAEHRQAKEIALGRPLRRVRKNCR